MDGTHVRAVRVAEEQQRHESVGRLAEMEGLAVRVGQGEIGLRNGIGEHDAAEPRLARTPVGGLLDEFAGCGRTAAGEEREADGEPQRSAHAGREVPEHRDHKPSRARSSHCCARS